jgi:cell division septal protein FtsQ
MTARGPTARRHPAPHARRPAPALRFRLRRSLPAPGRIAAALLLATLVAGLLAVLNGPWLRVGQIAWAGERFTPANQLDRLLGALDGAPLLTVSAGEVAGQLRLLPAVAEARVTVTLPGSVSVTLVEKEPAFVWQTSAVRLIGAADGALIGELALRAPLPDDLSTLPLIDDRRVESRNIIVGDRLDERILASALRLAMVEPAMLGSRAGGLQVRLTDADGFLLVSAAPRWQANFGYYPPADDEELGTLDEQVEAQVAAVRTLFSLQAEGGVSWVDARNPGRVYWRP